MHVHNAGSFLLSVSRTNRFLTNVTRLTAFPRLVPSSLLLGTNPDLVPIDTNTPYLYSFKKRILVLRFADALPLEEGHSPP